MSLYLRMQLLMCILYSVHMINTVRTIKYRLTKITNYYGAVEPTKIGIVSYYYVSRGVAVMFRIQSSRTMKIICNIKYIIIYDITKTIYLM